MDENTKSGCNPQCVYFPQEASRIIREDEKNGVKTRCVERLCAYDMRPIVGWNECHRSSPLLLGVSEKE